MNNEKDEIISRYDRAVHSDFLIHWTGKDIDLEHHPRWYSDEHNSRTCDTVTDLYIQRLQNILKFGLWMTEETEEGRQFKVGQNPITAPIVPHCCFTELKVSDSRRHAALFGRLGIGVKRRFLFDRSGRPLAYFGFRTENHWDKLLEGVAQNLEDPRLLNFFKPMNRPQGDLDYSFYAESEWRILGFEELLAGGKIIDPRDSSNKSHHAYFNSLPPEAQKKLKYLVPLDGWFAMIIYPSLTVKNRAQWEDSLGIREEIKRIKLKRPDLGNEVEGLTHHGKLHKSQFGNWPLEIHLDSCRHF